MKHYRKDLRMLPLSLLRTAQNHPMLVELKNGETYNGHLVSCDNWMNINLREASVKSIQVLKTKKILSTGDLYKQGWR